MDRTSQHKRSPKDAKGSHDDRKKASSFPKTIKGPDLYASSDYRRTLFWKIGIPKGCWEAEFALAWKVAQANSWSNLRQ